jgi:futalosine hydrolase
MEVLIVSATFEEISNLYEKISGRELTSDRPTSIRYKNHEISFLISGIGQVAMATNLSLLLATKKYDLVINTGIAGSFRPHLKIGDVVLVNTEVFSDLGVQHADGSFSDLFETGLIQEDAFPFTAGRLRPVMNYSGYGYPCAAGISVNLVHGEQTAIDQIMERYHPDVESMEGAAFFYVCLKVDQKCLQVRAISNVVEKRNRNNWNIPLAITSLANALTDIIDAYSSNNSN